MQYTTIKLFVRFPLPSLPQMIARGHDFLPIYQ